MPSQQSFALVPTQAFNRILKKVLVKMIIAVTRVKSFSQREYKFIVVIRGLGY
jgi:hypothetical protein